MSDHANSGTSSEIWHEQQTIYFLVEANIFTHTKIFSHLVDDDGAELLLGVVVLELILVQRRAGEQVQYSTVQYSTVQYRLQYLGNRSFSSGVSPTSSCRNLTII